MDGKHWWLSTDMENRALHETQHINVVNPRGMVVLYMYCDLYSKASFDGLSLLDSQVSYALELTRR